MEPAARTLAPVVRRKLRRVVVMGWTVWPARSCLRERSENRRCRFAHEVVATPERAMAIPRDLGYSHVVTERPLSELHDLRERLRTFAHERDWGQFHTP